MINSLNEMLNKYVSFVDDLKKDFNYPDNICHLLYLIVPAFVLKYGVQNERAILNAFREVPIFISKNEDEVTQAFYSAQPYKTSDFYATKKCIVLKHYNNSNLIRLLDNLIHEMNHALNSLKNEVMVKDDKVYIRTGVAYIIYNKELEFIGKSDSFIIEEIINTFQTERIIDIINSFNKDIENLDNPVIKNALYSIGHVVSDKNYSSESYALQTYICKELVNNKGFTSTMEMLRFSGNVDDLDYLFDQTTGQKNSFNKLCSILKSVLDDEISLSHTKWFRKRRINKIRNKINRALEIINLYSDNCNYK